MQCWESDDSIVVMKSWPMKAGNSVEDKTEMICGIVSTEVCVRQKRHGLRRDEACVK